MGTTGFSRILAALQKVGLGDSTSCCCNQVRPEELGYGGLVTVMDPLSIHLKDLNRGEDVVFMQVAKLQVGAEGGPLGVEGDSNDVRYVAAAYGCLRSTDITDERALVGGWYMVQEPEDCGEYFE